ncbi:Bug family tripartite tricarboxylate transporter substrate binding protein [Crenalkalicoccus roseus]|uniref:Bug family tripartite tricarboxylate transporter substrate binding protein n=1 Tax=Crenalkalicoccus roseus TaxID=1485588 RepID=UPI001EFF8FF5|nr:tripartite tricarboxylate transporter substrate binding protein [Crenalkalicoccus roseus]
MRTTRRGLAALGLALGAAPRARAQGWPDRPIRFVVPFPPGGPVDTYARIMAQALTGPLGQQVIVENRSGAGGNIGIDAVAKSPPDGHTIAVGSTGAVAVNISLLPNMPYDTLRDLAPVTIMAATPSVLVVRPNGPETLAALLAEAHRRPGRLTFASTGPGGTPHLAAELLKLRTGVDLTHVAYRGAAPVITAMLGGEIDMCFLDVPVLLPHIREGKFRALCVTAKERSAVLPEVPTTAEAGAPGVEVENWYSLLAPAATPPERVRRLSEAVRGVLAPGSETHRRFTEMGARVLALDPEQATAFIRAEIAKWAEVIRLANITPG